MTEVRALLRYFRMSPRKVRMVSKIIKGLDITRAERELKFRNKKAAQALLKLLKSAVSNALQKGLDKNKLYVKNVIINKGPVLKRFYFKAGGRVGKIEKKTSHIEVILGEKSNGS